MHTVGHSNINACRAGSLSGWLQQNLTSSHRKKGKLFTVTRIDKNLLRPLFSIISLMKCFLQESLHTTTEQNIFALKELCYVCLRHILVTALTRGFMVENCASRRFMKAKIAVAAAGQIALLLGPIWHEYRWQFYTIVMKPHLNVKKNLISGEECRWGVAWLLFFF